MEYRVTKHILIVLLSLLLSGCVGNYRADYGIVIKVVREEKSNEVTVSLSGNPYEIAGNPYEVFGLTVRDELIFHTPADIRYAVGDTIRFNKQ